MESMKNYIKVLIAVLLGIRLFFQVNHVVFGRGPYIFWQTMATLFVLALIIHIVALITLYIKQIWVLIFIGVISIVDILFVNIYLPGEGYWLERLVLVIPDLSLVLVVLFLAYRGYKQNALNQK